MENASTNGRAKKDGTSVTREVDVLVAGAGASGIGAAIQLRKHGILDFVVLEKAREIGGTWRDNTYPGCACDVPSALYSYSFAPNPSWSRAFAERSEIHRYLKRTAEENGVMRHVELETELLSARWNEATSRWEIETTKGRFLARIFLAACGPWHEPKMPEVRGLDRFRGAAFHTARWDDRVELADKRVAIIGTGASAVQIIPKIQPEVRELHVFQRTPSWVLPKPDHAVHTVEQSIFRHVPGAMRALRGAEYGLLELLAVGFRHPKALRLLEHVSELHLRRSIADESLREKLRPSFTLGCKRILLSNEYFRAFAEKNVMLHTTAVRSLDESAIEGDDGSRTNVDVVLFGTGFHILDQPVAKLVANARGKTLDDVWKGSPEAYLGTSIAGFPNFFLLLGPNLGTGHSSAFTVLEAQLRYVLDAITTMRARGFESVDVRADVQAAYNAEIQAALRTTVYNAGGCASYYIDENGRNSFGWPWSTSRMEATVRAFDPSKYVVVGSKRDVSFRDDEIRARRRGPTSKEYPPIDLRGAVVAITGAARGIGRATSEAFLREGAIVCMSDRDEDAVLSAARSLSAITSGSAFAAKVDVTQRASLEAWLHGIERDHGPVDVLVNNAGLMPLGAFTEELDRTSRTTLDVNLWGPILGCRIVFPRIAKRRRGHVVNVASMAGKIPLPGAAVYNASKFGLVGLSAALREEMAPHGVSVSTVLPSAVRTGLISGAPVGRGLPMVDPEDIARAIVDSVRTRRAEITVPSWMSLYDLAIALTPRAVVAKIRASVGVNRALHEVDPRARATYDGAIEEQAHAIERAAMS